MTDELQLQARVTECISQTEAARADIKKILEIVTLNNSIETFKQLIGTRKDFAEVCRVSEATIRRREGRGLYNPPDPDKPRAIFNQGNQGNILVNIPLAMDYYEVNIAKNA